MPSKDSILVSSVREDTLPVSAMHTGSSGDERSRNGGILQRVASAERELLEVVDAVEDITSFEKTILKGTDVCGEGWVVGMALFKQGDTGPIFKKL